MSDFRLPYPGLRSFRPDETDLFFGRDACINEMVERLAATRFLAVLGTSGSGKSSLVYTGLLDGLGLGLMAMAGPRWAVAAMRPAGRPIANLARALLGTRQGQGSDAAGSPTETDVAALTDRLRDGPRAVAQWCREDHLPQRTNLLLVIDQFEELFRYANYAGREEAEAFVALLLESAAAQGVPIYVVLTMRSEFLGPCALFPDLAERINAGLYLTRRMTRDEMQDAITGPAGVCGFVVEPALVARLLNDLESFTLAQEDGGGDQLQQLARRADQLPLMQHVLNRLWLRAQGGSPTEPIMLRLADYDGLGGMSGALNDHAEEVLRNVAPEYRDAAEPVFRALMSGETVATALRIGRRVGELIEIAGKEKRAAVEKVIEAFRDPSCNFLMASREGAIDDDTVIDISHESLIRHWGRLGMWLQHEAKKAADYRYLDERAHRWDRREAGLLTMPDLRTLRDWQARERPNAVWARRYGGDFKLAERFLGLSVRRYKLWLWGKIGAASVAGIILVVGPLLWIAQRQHEQLVLQKQENSRLQEALNDYRKGLSFEFPTASGAVVPGTAGNPGQAAANDNQPGSSKARTNALSAGAAARGQPDYQRAMYWYLQAAQLGSADAEFRIGYLYAEGRGVTRSYAVAADWYLKSAGKGEASAENNLGVLYEHGRGVRQDYAQAVSWYLKAAAQSDTSAEINLGLLYARGQGVAQSYVEAASWFGKAASQGNATGEYNLGVLYDQGRGVKQSDTEAAKWYLLAANHGSASAENNLGWLYQSGRGVKQSDVEAAKWYLLAANQGDTAAQNNIGWFYQHGRGVPQDYRKAAFWYRKAADQGDPTGEYNIGVLYGQGNGVAQNYAEAAKWYLKSASQGDALAQYNLGVLYDEGHGVPQSYAVAAGWYRKAADQGYSSAENNLGWLYQSGHGVKQNYADAASWYLKAANQGNAMAQKNLGALYDQGLGVKRDYATAASWYQKAADQGNATAQNHLGWLYQSGQGVPQDYGKAAFWYRKAADQGDPTGEYNIGVLYGEGKGVKQDLAQAASWYLKAANQGDVLAEYNLGVLYDEGRGVPQSYALAAEWYRKAADQGDASAQNNLGWLYQSGHGVKQSYADAASWYLKSADHGDAMGQKNLGALYDQGLGVKQDYAAAASWYRKAADQGNATAQNNLGWLYQMGRGVKQSYVDAATWYLKAANQGDAQAQLNLGWLYDSGGYGLKQDYAQALNWYRKAAANGNSDAMYNIGNQYALGHGVAQNDAEAIAWFAKDAAAGDPDGQRRIGEIYFHQGKYDAALAAYRASVKLAQTILTKVSADPTATGAVRSAAQKIGEVAYALLLHGEFQNALDASIYAIALAPDQLWLQTNRADALMMLGRLDEARAIYLGNRGKKDAGDKSWIADVLGDFASLRKKGYSSPLMAEIEAAFQQQSAMPLPHAVPPTPTPLKPREP
jgi:TPR repeat protein